MPKKLLLILFITFIYAVSRYVVFGNISASHLPIFILNKAVSFSSVIFLFLASFCRYKSKNCNSKFWELATWYSITLHIFLSVFVLTSSYFPKFFDGKMLSLSGELTLLFGVAATYCFWIIKSGKLKLFAGQKSLFVGQLLVALHLFTMGFKGWITFDKWQGGLPPISLLSFIFVLMSLSFFFLHPVTKKLQQ